MVKDLKKTQERPTNIINNVLGDNKKPKKLIDNEYYQKNKEVKKAQRRERYAHQKEQEQLANQKLYEAQSIQVLLSLKNYTELNREKKKLWLDFCWTLQDCQDKEGIKIYDIVQIQKLELLAGNLIRDYYETAKGKGKVKGSWGSLSEEKKSKLIKYWGAEKARKEHELSEALREQEKAGELWEKDLELAKFHEERGKIKCACYDCENKKVIAKEAKAQILNDKEEKEQCPECGKVVKLDEENGVCKKCLRRYE